MLPPNSKGKLDVGGALGWRAQRDQGHRAEGALCGTDDPWSQGDRGGFDLLLATSEQIPSSVALGVLMNRDNTVSQSGGFIIQLMPGAPEDMIDRLEARLKEIASVTTLLDEGNTPEMILEHVLGEFGLELNDRVPVQFHCNCTKARVEKALISVGRKDIQEMIDDGKAHRGELPFLQQKLPVYSG